MTTEILFKNDYGTLNISGGLNPLLSATSVQGLAMPEKDVKTAVFSNLAGQKTLSVRDKAREITIHGILEGDLSFFAQKLYKSGSLIFKNERFLRVIDARCSHISDRSTDGKITVTFSCDSPYFHDSTDIKTPVYSRIKLISSPFTLPAVFTKRVREGVCENQSLVPSEPTIIVYNKGDVSIEGFTVTNTTTNAEITMNCTLNPNEHAVIDIEKRTVTSQSGENLLPYLNASSYLCDFVLAPGKNLIKLTAVKGLECEIIYNTNYTEAVI